MNEKIWKEVRYIMQNPPATGKYEKLKSELIRRLGVSQDIKTRKLLEHEEMGGRKPYQFLRHFRILAGTAVPDEVIKTLWLSSYSRVTEK